MKNISQYLTKELTEELKKREGVKFKELAPYDVAHIKLGNDDQKIVGPAIILINID
ncbi:hypothetical protein IX329_000729 [Fusobacterium necrophorum]|uniref:BC1881 family protein n=1 Tax=Fusobacterium necrophorum TaxID=859 RepID=UPI001B8B05F8|nr:BC1881 family protein [Fusobacterium necrophorum]MBR8733156.1 hypothetical protein [Fusobacterium necrophorum]MBR8789300.1 hypothetical protein [Fusobacterium necrophorum]MCI7343019.1 BC1881 family protein [Fusobacterium necrophorum]